MSQSDKRNETRRNEAKLAQSATQEKIQSLPNPKIYIKFNCFHYKVKYVKQHLKN